MSNTNPIGSNQVLKKVYDEILRALRVKVVEVSPAGFFATNPTIVNITIALANTEQNYSLPTDTKKFLIKNRGDSMTKLSYLSGDSGSVFVSIPPGAVYEESGILTNATLYFQTESASDIIEIVSWT